MGSNSQVGVFPGFTTKGGVGSNGVNGLDLDGCGELRLATSSCVVPPELLLAWEVSSRLLGA